MECEMTTRINNALEGDLMTLLARDSLLGLQLA
jgi:hypothetical protein